MGPALIERRQLREVGDSLAHANQRCAILQNDTRLLRVPELPTGTGMAHLHLGRARWWQLKYAMSVVSIVQPRQINFVCVCRVPPLHVP